MKKETKNSKKLKKAYEKPDLKRHGKLTDVGSFISPPNNNHLEPG